LHRRIFGTECEYALVDPPRRRDARKTPGADSLDRRKQLAAHLIDGAGSLGVAMAGEFLGNGGRLYLDRGGHPEYATPECRRVADLVAYEIAGDRLLQQLTQLRPSREEPGRVHVYKNNVDLFGHTYGAHENYLITAQGLNDIGRLLPFLVTRQIYTGAGKAMTSAQDGACGFQISQRADFFDATYSDRTSEIRGIINIRKREIARVDQGRRLHLIIGDSNMAQYTIGLKVGTLLLMLRLLEAGALDADFELLSPPNAFKAVSRDLDARIACHRHGRGAHYSASEIQSMYLEKALAFFAANPPEMEEAQWLEIWQQTVCGLKDLKIRQGEMALERDSADLKRKIDWILKLWLLDRSRTKGADERQLKILDFKYHDLDPDAGLYQRCLSLGLVDRMVDERAVAAARCNPPQNTRARLRGLIVQQAFETNVDVRVENWERIRIRASHTPGARHGFNRVRREINSMNIDLQDPFHARDARMMEDLQQFIKKWGRQDAQ
jgi:proteasome accessory factor A